jgi:hypothetical protein
LHLRRSHLNSMLGRLAGSSHKSNEPRNPGGTQISADRLPPNVDSGFDPPQRPSQPPQRDYLFSLVLAQDIAHVDGGYSPRLD